ncbi:MlaE family ABC transporter permease [Roseivivax isoporae]|uniref:ABC transporter permease n=1 Tax=Roseivivax isoporae LMG 25204 TaxID=1449351 RepID=X7F8L5_9RHOB|nr:ABC transporter permease [Roseivivax isoporae]ETX28436.1 ABC transporter permease [Roseivivax isoporae LMG 25204]
MTDAAAEIDTVATEPALILRIRGRLTLAEMAGAGARLRAVAADRPVTLDLSRLLRLDTAGAWAIVTLRARLAAEGHALRIEHAAPEVESLLVAVEAALPRAESEPRPRRSLPDRLDALGRRVAGAGHTGAEMLGIFGLFLARLGRSLVHPREFRLTALVHHCEEVGFRAVPIVALMAFLIGVVLAFQGAVQLRQFGAEVFVVDLIAISILRELGILLTSIIVAGRTASAFTAAIGSMKMREEIDAMRTLGLDPAAMLFVPRILALLLMLPILGLIANVAGLFGGGLMAWLTLDISPGMFLTRLVDGTDVENVMVGLVKAPAFAVIIGVVGCHAGMKVGSNAESLGRQTSSAVVAAIFAVIVADAVFSVFFAQVGI